MPGVDQGLWERLGRPKRVHLRRHRGHALILEPDADGSFLINPLGPRARWTIALNAEVQRALGLPASPYVSLTSLTMHNRLYLSDFSSRTREDLRPVEEAAKLYGASRQGIAYLIAQRGLHLLFDGVRRKLSRQAVQEIRKRAIAVDSLSTCAYNEMVLLWLRQRNQTA